jgi:hypothetical protein
MAFRPGLFEHGKVSVILERSEEPVLSVVEGICGFSDECNTRNPYP